jgi:hypothetical protein
MTSRVDLTPSSVRSPDDEQFDAAMMALERSVVLHMEREVLADNPKAAVADVNGPDRFDLQLQWELPGSKEQGGNGPRRGFLYLLGQTALVPPAATACPLKLLVDFPREASSG